MNIELINKLAEEIKKGKEITITLKILTNDDGLGSSNEYFPLKKDTEVFINMDKKTIAMYYPYLKTQYIYDLSMIVGFSSKEGIDV
jgi:hypothetical protein